MCSRTSSSTRRWSSFPALNCRRSFSRIRSTRPSSLPSSSGVLLVGNRLQAGQQQIEQTFFAVLLRLFFNLGDFLDPNHIDRDLHQVAHHGFHIPADVTNFSKFRSLDFEEGGVCQASQTPRDFGLSYSGRTDHDDVLGRDFFGHLVIEFLAADAVAQRNGHRLFRPPLSHDILVQFGDYLARQHLVEPPRIRGPASCSFKYSHALRLRIPDC